MAVITPYINMHQHCPYTANRSIVFTYKCLEYIYTGNFPVSHTDN